ncbi:MAG: amidohydrolase [Flavobacteriales bacterium]|nr:amidohydrolase [Flavobacteriales bacterium]
MDIKSIIKDKAATYKTEVIAIRRHLHQYPELSFNEFETANFVEQKLKEFGITKISRLVKTGVVALIEGKNPSAKVIALRADLDALRIQETNEVGYKSKNDGVMHACGHDVHTSSLLGVAKVLQELRTEFEGTIKLIFQPGEEKLPGGASLMIAEGVFENPNPESIIGQHVFPELEAGKVGFKSGMYMASTDEIYVTVKGKGGHAALPHLVIDPVLITSHIIVALQQVVSRLNKPTTPSVLSFGKVSANGATNIIPDKVLLEGTFRTMDEDWRAKAHTKMKKMAETIAESMGGECEFNIVKGYPFLVNNEDLTNKLKQAAIDFLGKDNVVDLELRMTAEDFAYYSQVKPACFYRLGIRNEKKQINAGLHTSKFNIDEDAIETSIGLMTWLAICEMQS